MAQLGQLSLQNRDFLLRVAQADAVQHPWQGFQISAARDFIFRLPGDPLCLRLGQLLLKLSQPLLRQAALVIPQEHEPCAAHIALKVVLGLVEPLLHLRQLLRQPLLRVLPFT